ncbi:MAG: DUF1570 domain-containing protein [Sphingorhabdus sp.]
MRHILSKLVTVFLAACFTASPVQAKWYEASSDHFVIYAEQREKDVRRFAENLERYHAALVYMRKFGDKPPPSKSNRVTIFVTDSRRDVSKLAGDKSGSVAGFYVPRAGGSVAFTPPVRNTNSKLPDFTQIVLLHEYAHHYMISNLPIALPRWYTEGFAEFFGTTTFSKDGSVGLGKPATHRAGELGQLRRVPWKLLLDSRAYAARKNKKSNSFYGQSWAIFHYLQVTPEGRKMHNDYLARLIKGESEIEAAEGAFGDIKEFGKKIDKYLRRTAFKFFPISAEKVKIGEIKLRELSVGEAKVMPLRMRSKRGVNEEQAAKLVVEARKVAAKYPGDAAVYSVLAEAEFDAGNDNAAITAADKALALNPKHINALLQKGYALFRKAGDNDESGDEPGKAWATVRKHFLSINKVETNHPIPLIYFYRTYLEQGREPTENAKNALDWALQLAPFDKGLRFMVAQQDMNDGRYSEARFRLLPLAYDPHRSGTEEGPVFAMLREAEIKLGMRKEEASDEGDATEDTATPEAASQAG